ncbi:hypothetical protein F5Y19DRAFT_326093 [Xylariaceae sp. FL1651]|nr:hypothetical protein F5Y19DRAFT_326093 [Xylariaceae sp. FL1651]
MSKIPISSPAPPKRRKKNQSKTRRPRASSRTKNGSAEEVSALAEKTCSENSSSQMAYRSAGQLDGELMTTLIPMPIRSAASTNETTCQLSSNDGVASIPEDCLSLDGRSSPFVEIWDDSFTPDTPGCMVQSQIASVLQTDINPGTICLPFHYERQEIPKLEEEAMGTITATNFNPSDSRAAPFPFVDFGFSQSPVASSPDSAFDFNPDVDIDSALTVTRFPVSNWQAPNSPSVFTDPVSPEQFYTYSPQLQQTGFCTDLGQNAMSGSNGNTSNGIGIYPGSSFYDQFQDQDSLNKKDVANSLIDSSPDILDYSTNDFVFSPHAPVASFGKSSRKRPFLEEDKDDRDKNCQFTNSRRPSRDNGGKSLACPFHKMDPHRYNECGRYTLRRIKDVKQHIYRLHCKPELYCSRCYQNFKSSSERDLHIRDGGCTLKEAPNHDGIISEHQKKELKDCGSRGTSKEQQWMEVWDVIFPNMNRPRSSYVDNGQAELLCSLRSYWDGNAGEIIARSLGEPGPECVDFALIRNVVGLCLDQFETKLTDWDLTTNRERCIAPQVTQPLESSFEDMLNHMLPTNDEELV